MGNVRPGHRCVSGVLHFPYRTDVLYVLGKEEGCPTHAYACVRPARPFDVEERYSTGGFVPVLLGPQERGQLIRLLIDACPYEGWVGLYGVRHIGWEWAQRQGMDLERVLVLNTDEEANAGQLCALLLEGCDVVCLDLPQLSRTEQRTLAARARSLGRTLVTLRMWPGLSRDAAGAGNIRLVV